MPLRCSYAGGGRIGLLGSTGGEAKSVVIFVLDSGWRHVRRASRSGQMIQESHADACPVLIIVPGSLIISVLVYVAERHEGKVQHVPATLHPRHSHPSLP